MPGVSSVMGGRIPVAARVDVVVVGGTASAVACALRLREAGRSVFLAAPRAYLGEDVAAPMRFWLDDAALGAADRFSLARSLFLGGATVGGAALPPTPMHVKRTLEHEAVEAGVSFVFNTHPGGLVRNGEGRAAGVVLVNRAGRQIVLAAEVVDATWRGQLARQAGVTFLPPATGPREVGMVTVGEQDAGSAADVATEALAPFVYRPTGSDDAMELPACRHRLTVDLGDGGPWSLARAEAEAIERCWSPGLFLHADRMDVVWGDRVDRASLGRAESLEGAVAAAPSLWLLGPMSAVSAGEASRLAEPVASVAAGDALGLRLAEAAMTRAASGADLHVVGYGEPADGGELRAGEEGLRPGDGAADGWLEAAPAPRLGEVDVAVAGGGTAGAPAGISAARVGARTVVLEATSMLGGVGTAGQIAKYWFGNLVGFTSEIDRGTNKLEVDEKVRRGRATWTPQAKAAWYRRALLGAGGEVWFNSFCGGAWTQSAGGAPRVAGVLAAGPFGVGVIEAKAVVDATGGADVAAAAGAPVRVIDGEHVAFQGVGLGGLAPKRYYHNTDHSFSDDADVVDATAFFVATRRKFESDFDLGQLIDSRERRQILGELTLDPVDFFAGRRFPDTICRSSSNFDTHGFVVHPLFIIDPPDKTRLWVDVPYRCLLPRGVGGLLVTGLGISAHRDALPVVRMQGDVQNQGYAAGRAAAIAARGRIDVRAVDVRHLQRHLVTIGSLDESVLSDEDSFPLGEAKLAWAAGEGFTTREGLAICLAEADRCRPRLAARFETETDDAVRDRLAQTLGMLGAPSAAPELARRIAGQGWDAGWNYTGMGQFGMSNSAMDARVTALGHCGDTAAWPVILEKIAQLGLDPDFSHCRACVEAAEVLHARVGGGEAAGEAIADLLRRAAATGAGLTGHAQTTLREAIASVTPDPCETRSRNLALRELHLARGAARCGDAGRVGRRILEQYRDDLRGPFARHARAVLRTLAETGDRARAAAEA